jgi:hypothetical protein
MLNETSIAWLSPDVISLHFQACMQLPRNHTIFLYRFKEKHHILRLTKGQEIDKPCMFIMQLVKLIIRSIIINKHCSSIKFNPKGETPMAQDTPLNYRSLVIYEIFVRNHGPNGTFSDVESDLERIKSMGVDVIWFMPIHPIGAVARKGSLGSPYSISDYRGINPEYGTRDDFARLIEKAHQLGLKVWIDVVYNHTAHDSKLVKEHPQWFHQDSHG